MSLLGWGGAAADLMSLSGKPRLGPGGSGRGGAGAKGKDEIISVDEELWTLQLGARNPPCNVAKFDEVWLGKNGTKTKMKVCTR